MSDAHRTALMSCCFIFSHYRTELRIAVRNCALPYGVAHCRTELRIAVQHSHKQQALLQFNYLFLFQKWKYVYIHIYNTYFFKILFEITPKKTNIQYLSYLLCNSNYQILLTILNFIYLLISFSLRSHT